MAFSQPPRQFSQTYLTSFDLFESRHVQIFVFVVFEMRSLTFMTANRHQSFTYFINNRPFNFSSLDDLCFVFDALDNCFLFSEGKKLFKNLRQNVIIFDVDTCNLHNISRNLTYLLK